MLSNMSSKNDQVCSLTEKQGIVTILGSDMKRMGAAASLRRTLSADMSCNKWLAQNVVPPLKRTSSSKELQLPKIVTPDSSSFGGEEDAKRGQDEIWTSIQQYKMNQRNKMMQVEAQQGQFDIWSSIISQKECELETSKSAAPPYVHPLVKRSKSSLSERSLQICTESLGSETGSDGFSSFSPSENGDAENQDKVEEQDQQQSDAAEEDFRLSRYNYAAATKKATPRPFPPPLPSLSHSDGASLRMRTVRDNGRLVMDAVSVPSQSKFRAERQDGRLLLTFVDVEEHEVGDGDEQVLDNHCLNEQEMDDMKEEFVESGYDQGEKEHVEDVDEASERGVELEDEEVETQGIEIVIDSGIRNMSSASITNVHRLMLKPCVSNRNLPWPQKFNEVVKFKETEEEKVKVDVVQATPVAQSLPPRPRPTRLIPSTPVGSATAGAPGSLNAFEYYWKPRPTSKAETQIFNQFIKHQESSQHNCNKLVLTKNVQMQNDRQQVIVFRGKNGEYLIPMSKNCKESRTSVLYWQPYCIASS